MATPGLELNPTLANVDGQVQDLFRALASGFQKLDKVKDPNRQSKQLEELTGKMREAKRLIKDFDREIKEEESNNSSEQNRQLNEKKQALIKELNSYVALRKTYTSALGGGRNELLDGGGQGEPLANEGVKLASTMTNRQLIDTGRKQMDETDQTLERSKKVVQDTVNIGEQTALTLKSQEAETPLLHGEPYGVRRARGQTGVFVRNLTNLLSTELVAQTEQMGRIVNELDTIQFSIKKASQLVKEISRQLATDKCIMVFLLLIVCGVIAIIVVKVVNPKNKDITNLPGLAPPVSTNTNRRLLLVLLE